MIKLGFSNLVKLKPNSVYLISYLDDFTSNFVKSPLENGRYTNCKISPTDSFGKLNAKVDLMSLDKGCEEVPKSVHILIIGTSNNIPESSS